MEIKPGKYKTRGGRDAIVLTVDAEVSMEKIIGYVIIDCVTYSYARAVVWGMDGRVYVTLQDSDDLVEFVE